MTWRDPPQGVTGVFRVQETKGEQDEEDGKFRDPDLLQCLGQHGVLDLPDKLLGRLVPAMRVGVGLPGAADRGMEHISEYIEFIHG